MAELFQGYRAYQRDQLRRAGWRESGGLLQGLPMWTRPDGTAVLGEDEAIAEMLAATKEVPDGHGQ